MTDILSTRRISHPADVVFAAAHRIEHFPDVLPDLDKVTVLSDDGAGAVTSRWEGTISVGPLTRRIGWTEQDHWDEQARSCTFDLIEGDMKIYRGTWTFSPDGEGCMVELKVQFELGIPLLGALVNRIVDQIIQHNCDALLEALDKLSA